MSEQLIKIIRDRLFEMGCTDITVTPEGDRTYVARFNCQELTSFNKRIDGWAQLGIELNDTATTQSYKIVFVKLSTNNYTDPAEPTNSSKEI